MFYPEYGNNFKWLRDPKIYLPLDYFKDHPTKSHSTCSDGSLLSMGSSEIEEDSFGQQSSRHSSKRSLHDKKAAAEDSEWELEPSSASVPLNHSAAHHRVAVRPKRTHGAPRRKRMQPMGGTALPTTPEVNEDSSLRSLTPETSSKEIVTELHSNSSSTSMSKTRTESQLKCSSLPPGLAGLGTESNKLNRSRSSVGGGSSSSKSQDAFVTLGEEDEGRDDKKSDHSIFARLFPRRSGKKKKSKQENTTVSVATSATPLCHSEKVSAKRLPSVDKVIRSGPASRQRIQPIDLPASPEITHRELINVSPDRPSTSPLQLELENHFRQRTGPSPKFFETPPRSPKSPSRLSPSPHPGLVWPEKSENLQYLKTSSTRYLEGFEETKNMIVNIEENKSKVIVAEDIKNDVMTRDDSKSKAMVFSLEDFRNTKFKLSEDSKSKIKIAGLSSLQQRVLQQHTDDTSDNTFKSLTDFTCYEQSTTNRLVTKSHSFKSKSNDSCSQLKGSNRYTYTSAMSKSDTSEAKSFAKERIIENSIFKTNSLDSIKNLHDNDQFEEDKRLIKSESSESLESETSVKTSSTEYLDSLNPTNGITISGPSHTSVVSVCTKNEIQLTDAGTKTHAPIQPLILNVEKVLEHGQSVPFKESLVKEEQTQISVTKVHVKRESMQITQNTTTNKNNGVPEFLSIHLNKVDAKPTTNVVLTANVTYPKLEINGESTSNQNNTKQKSTFCFESVSKPEIFLDTPLRKFSQDDIEIVDKDVGEEIVEVPSRNVSTPSTPSTPPNVIITSMAPPLSSRIYKKHSEIPSQPRKSSLVMSVSETKTKVNLCTKSNSLDIVDSLKHCDSDVEKPIEKSKVFSATDLQESLSSEVVVMRRKSLVRKKQDDEPELMKVFARRSLKLKDADEIAQQVLVMVKGSKDPESNKENHLDSPVDERRKLTVKEQEKAKEPLIETKFVETTEVMLRKPVNNKLFTYQQRTISLNVPKANEINNPIEKVQKIERPKTEVAEKITNKTWIAAVRKDPDGKDELKKISSNDVIAEISPSKNDFINEDFPTIPKNFNQRKAEWEKRAQEALKKSVP